MLSQAECSQSLNGTFNESLKVFFLISFIVFKFLDNF